MSASRPVRTRIQAHRQEEGGGFVVRRPFPHALDMVDPFLMVDEMGPVTYRPEGAIGGRIEAELA